MNKYKLLAYLAALDLHKEGSEHAFPKGREDLMWFGWIDCQMQHMEFHQTPEIFITYEQREYYKTRKPGAQSKQKNKAHKT